MTEPDLAARRDRLERTALGAFAVGALTMAIVCGAVIVSHWFAGVLDDRFERFFWAGSIAGFLMVVAFAAACFPGGRDDRRVVRRITFLLRAGIVLFIASPVLCIGALIADFYL